MPYTFEDGTPVPDLGAYRLEPEKKKGITSDIARGVDNLQSTLYGLGALGANAFGLPKVEDWALEGYKRNQEEAQANPPEIGSFRNIPGDGVMDTLGNTAKYIREAVGENVPMMVPSLATGGAGAFLARKAAEKAVAAQVGKKIAEEEAKRQIARKTLTGGALGAYPPAAGIEAGSIYGDIYDQTGEKRPGVAAGYGALAGALDVAPELMLFNRALLPAKQAGMSALKRYGTDAAKQFAAEGSTEGLQTVLEKSAVKQVDPTKDIFSAQNTDEIIDSILKGGIAGGGMSAVANVMSPREKTLADTADMVRKSHEQLLARETEQQARELEAKQPEPSSAIREMEAKPDEIFAQAKARPEILNTIDQAASDIPAPYRNANPIATPISPIDNRPDVGQAIQEMTPEPKKLLESALAKPGVESTIGQAVADLEQVSQERKPYEREYEALSALRDTQPVTPEDTQYLTANKLARADNGRVAILPAGRRRLKELEAQQATKPPQDMTDAELDLAQRLTRSNERRTVLMEEQERRKAVPENRVVQTPAQPAIEAQPPSKPTATAQPSAESLSAPAIAAQPEIQNEPQSVPAASEAPAKQAQTSVSQGPLSDPNIRAHVEALKGAIGRDEAGGRLIVHNQDTSPGIGDVVGKTVHLGDPLWFGRPDQSLSSTAAKAAIDKALAGKKLGAREQRFVDYVTEIAQKAEAEMQEDEALADSIADAIFDSDFATLTDEEKNREIEAAFGPADEVPGSQPGETGAGETDGASEAGRESEKPSAARTQAVDEAPAEAEVQPTAGVRESQRPPEPDVRKSGDQADTAGDQPKALELTGETEAEIKAREAETPKAEEKAVADRERDAFALQSPVGTTSAQPLSEPKNQQPLFSQSPDTTKKYEYALTLRPFSFATVPTGFTGFRKDDKWPHGVVIYDKPLLRKDINSFELEPLDPADPINIKKRNDKRREQLMNKFLDDGVIEGHYKGQPSNKLLLTQSARGDSPFQVTNFDGDIPTGHREYSDFEGAANEFVGGVSVRGIDDDFGKQKASPNVEASAPAQPQIGNEPTQSGKDETRFSRAASTLRSGIPKTADPPISSFVRAEKVREHPDYGAAKAGDIAAAIRLVRDLVKPESLVRAKRLGDAIYVSPMAQEATGSNAIPQALAAHYATNSGGSVDTGIVQINRAYHTGANAIQRLIARPQFDGSVMAGARYVLVDDVTTLGGTLAELAHHIQSGGGEVVGVITLVNASRNVTMVAPARVTREIERRFGDEVRRLFGVEPSALTAAEAGYLIGFRDADTLRNRATKAIEERADRLRSKGISGPEGSVNFERSDEAPPRAGLSIASLGKQEVSSWVDPIVSKWKNAPNVKIIQDMTEAPTQVQNVDAQQRQGGANDPVGFYYKDTVYLVASQLSSREKAVETLFHEALGHAGLRGVFGEKLTPILKQIASARSAEVKAKASEYGMDWNKESDRLIAAEEVLAELAQTKPELGFVKRAISAIRQFLRELGIDLKLTDDDIINQFILPARKFVEQGGTETEGVLQPAFSRAQPDWVTNGSAELKSAASKVDTFAPDKTIHEKVKALVPDLQKRLVQGLVDQFAPLKELSYKAYILARMTKSADGVLEGTLLYGKPKMDQDGAIIGDLDGKGFLGAMQELKGEHDRFFMWIAGQRSERLMTEGREHLFTPAEIQAMKQLNQGQMKDGTSRDQAYQQAAQTFKDYNKAVLDIAEKTGLIDGASRNLWEHDFYVPFFRIHEDDKLSAPAKIKGLVRQQAFKKLKGGQEPLGDLMGNTLRNWAHLISASLDNQAASHSLKAAEQAGVALEADEDTVRQMGKSIQNKKGVVYYMDQGKERYYLVDDPFVLTAISSMSAPDFKGPAMKAMRNFKRVLTLGVTASPSFRIRNLMRDTIAAIGQNDISYNALNNIVTGFKGTHKGSADYAQLLFGGGMMRFGTYLEDNRAEHVKRLIADGVDDSTILDTPAKVRAALGKWWDVYQEFGDRMENINRSALYKQLIAKGKSHQEASFAARDMLDFSMGGSFQAMRILTQIVPFLNARAQGLYKLGRAWKQDKRRLAYVTGAVATASIALMLAYEDDDEWKKRPDYDRDNNWWFRIGDTAYRIPKPFEIGAIGTLAERGWELMFNDEMTKERFAERMRYMVGQTFSMNPTPQLFKPMIDIYANNDSFTNRQIETRGMENLSKSERTAVNTSLVARAIGSVGDVTGISPVQTDFLIRAYFGWLGTHVAMTVDLMAQPFDDNEKPSRRIGDMFVVGDFVKDLPQDQSRYVEQFYKQAKQVSELMADIKHAREVGEIEKAKELMEENKDKIGLHRLYSYAERQMGLINKQIKLTQSKTTMSGDEKRERLDQLTAMKNQLAKTINEKATAARQSQ